ncbi:putative wd repeat-containing protein [Botrytis fragariae]|uniref:Putative wd repeat-containing protein n=1 Tax=Botrytis fragariae TaxID=1964551 RepID=A0A8H6AJ29_9HELO|nr:putative wd repeat-containing protein [Botrytis fragariae]KAF5868220.1 putative wd repeat-containing protein [Botrytis fragariae]
MSTNNSQLLDSHESSPGSYTPEDSGSEDTSDTGVPNPAVLDTLSQLRAQNAELQDKNTELRDQNTLCRIRHAQLQAQVEKHVAISQMRDQLAQPVKQVNQECRWHFWIICALIVYEFLGAAGEGSVLLRFLVCFIKNEMFNLSRKHAVILSFGLGISSTVASKFILTRVSTRDLSESALERGRKRIKDNAGGKHQKGSSGSHSTELTIRQHQSLGISCTCSPVASEIISPQELKVIMSVFEEADANDCMGSQQDVTRDKIIERFRLGVEKLSCKTLREIDESIIEKTCQKNGARITEDYVHRGTSCTSWSNLLHNHSLSPILAVEFYHTSTGALLILAAEGSFLKIYDVKTSSQIGQCRVFDSQAIHGIIIRELDGDSAGDLQVVVWGGQCLTLIRKSQIEEIISQHVTSITETATSASDWVLSVAFCPWENDGCVMVTAHNAMVQATLSKEDGTIRLRQLQPSSRSMLYSASLVCENKNTVIVAAGTIFGEVIVWKCVAAEDNSTFHNEALFVFTGHEGSIFGVDISPLIMGYDGKTTRLLASCSDDRTIRIWNLAEGSQNDADAMKLAADLLPRETGFGETAKPQQDSKGFNRCIAVTMGHASRIWGVKFHCPDISTFGTSPITILSFGEDSTAQQWTLELGSELQNGSKTSDASKPSSNNLAKLTHIKTFAFHTGKHIWSAAISQIENNQNLLVTGGADGKISTYCFEEERNTNPTPITASSNNAVEDSAIINSVEGSYHSVAFELEDVLKSLNSTEFCYKEEPDQESAGSKKNKKAPKDAFNRYAFVSESDFLITTTFGKILKATVGNPVKFKELSLPESSTQDLKSYSILKGNSNLGLCVLAGTNGKIFSYQPGLPIIQIGQVERKPSDVFVVPGNDNQSVELLVTLLGSEDLTIFSFNLESPGSRPIVDRRTLSLPPKFIVTGAGTCNGHLIIGSREGQIAVHDTKTNTMSTWNSPGKKDAITSIVAVPRTDSQQITSYFAITSRDGLYAIFSYNDEATPKISRVHSAAPPFGPMIEACWFQGSDLILYGFKSKSLIVWNETKQSEIMRIDCGGAHRAHAYSPLEGAQGGGSGHLIYTKASQLFLHSQKVPSHRTIKFGGHGREIKTCAIGGSPQMIATGAEDTNIRIWRYESTHPQTQDQNPNSQTLTCLSTIQKHTAGLQHLHWHNSHYLFSSGGVEEFYIWRIQSIPGFGLGVLCEASCPDSTAEQDLRIMSFDVSDIPGSEQEEMIITLAYSDSTMRTYLYSRIRGWKLLVRGQYTSACLMQIGHLQVSRSELTFLTAATDGSLCIWSAPLHLHQTQEQNQPQNIAETSASPPQISEPILISHTKIHQNAIKTLAFKYTSPSTSSTTPPYLVVITGGDDNAIGVTLYPISISSSGLNTKPNTFQNLITILIPDAHAAAVTGLVFIPDPHLCSADTTNSPEHKKKEEMYIVSSSTDQRVKTWRVGISSSLAAISTAVETKEEEKCPVDIEMIGDEFTAVSDIGDVGLIPGVDGNENEAKAIIVGNGMEIWGYGETR